MPGTKKHVPYCADVEELCAKGTCKEREKPGSGSRLGNFGKQTAARTEIFKGRRGARWPEYKLARAKLGTSKPTPTNSVGYYVQAHHMIAKSIYLKEKFFLPAAKCGWDIDNGLNCILLPKYCGYQMWEQLQFHKSGHWAKYFTYVEKKLNQIVSKYKVPDYCKIGKMKELHAKFHGLEEHLFNQLKMGAKLPLYTDTGLFYGGDYKDEVGTAFDKARTWDGTRKTYMWYLKHTKTRPRCPLPAVRKPAGG